MGLPSSLDPFLPVPLLLPQPPPPPTVTVPLLPSKSDARVTRSRSTWWKRNSAGGFLGGVLGTGRVEAKKGAGSGGAKKEQARASQARFGNGGSKKARQGRGGNGKGDRRGLQHGLRGLRGLRLLQPAVRMARAAGRGVACNAAG